ncbi:MAG: Arc family DNA-binding protein [Candidatus Riflebacteria bacterium]|nr:Arc family DNA-binding protein [Candidatus Riflebacteria bacterium]
MSVKKSFLLRINPEMFEALQHWANDEFRSLNSQLEYLLRDALQRSGRLSRDQKSVPSQDE